MIQLYVNDPSSIHHSASNSAVVHKRSIDKNDAPYANDGDAERKRRSFDENDDSHESLPSDTLANVQITPSIFMSMCPALLVQIEQGSCNEQSDVAADEAHSAGLGE